MPCKPLRSRMGSEIRPIILLAHESSGLPERIRDALGFGFSRAPKADNQQGDCGMLSVLDAKMTQRAGLLYRSYVGIARATRGKLSLFWTYFPSLRAVATHDAGCTRTLFDAALQK